MLQRQFGSCVFRKSGDFSWESLSPQQVARIQSDLILWDSLQRQNVVAETKIFAKFWSTRETICCCDLSPPRVFSNLSPSVLLPLKLILTFLVSLALAARLGQCKRFLFCVGGPQMWSQAFLAETVETGDKYLGVPKARSRELFRNDSVHGFYRLKALLLITLEQVNTSVVVNCRM